MKEQKGYMQVKSFVGLSKEEEINEFLKTVDTINVTHIAAGSGSICTIVSYYVIPVEAEEK